MMPSCLSILFRALRIEWRETKRTLFPPTPIETGLFLFFFLLYGCIGYRMLFHTELIDVPNGGAGSYLGYDNLFHLHTRGGAFDISHPFFGIFHLLKTLLTILLTTLFKEKTSGIICLTLMNLLITGGLVLIYRYLKQIVRISSRRALLLTGFTGCFSRPLSYHSPQNLIRSPFPARLLTTNAFQGIHADRIYKRPDDPLSLFPVWRNNNHQRCQTGNGPVPE